ncbi:IAH1 isoform 7, partial [Pan troglodytes]
EAAGCGSALLWPRLLLFGDSITQFSFQQGGWGASLADRLVRLQYQMGQNYPSKINQERKQFGHPSSSYNFLWGQ